MAWQSTALRSLAHKTTLALCPNIILDCLGGYLMLGTLVVRDEALDSDPSPRARDVRVVPTMDIVEAIRSRDCSTTTNRIRQVFISTVGRAVLTRKMPHG